MTAECTQVGFEFQSLNHRQIRAQFDGGAISSDGGGLLLREVDKRTGIIRKFAACFTDYRDPERISCSSHCSSISTVASSSSWAVWLLTGPRFFFSQAV